MMLRSLLSKTRNRMANPMKKLLMPEAKTGSDNVLPFCYDLAFSRQIQELQRLSLSTQTSSEQQNAQQPTSTSLEGNPYYSKYAEKIRKAQAEKAAEEAQHASTKSSEERPKVTPKEDKTAATTETPLKTTLKESKEAAPERSSSSHSEAPKTTKPSGKRQLRKQLNDIVKVDLLAEKSPEEITAIWNAYHAKRDGIYATIPAAIYQRLFETATKYPAFVLPLPRNKTTTTTSGQETKASSASSEDSAGGYEFFLLQFQEHSVYFTPMAAYHLHQQLAPVCLTLHHYPELSASKGLVLLNSEVDSNLLNPLECQCLANQLQHYYTTEDAAPRLSLHLFNRTPKSFDHMRLIAHLEAGMQSAGPMGSVNLDRQD